MNNDQIKERLLQLRPTDEHFEVILSGKKSKKVNGLYKSETGEIVLHNRNFQTDNELMYTAIHEYAHHLQFTSSPVPVSSRAHTVRFWSLFHGLLDDAEEMGLYRNPFDTIAELEELTREIKERFLGVNGQLMKDLGHLLLRANELCEKHRTSFGDYLDRILNLPRASAQAIMRSHVMDLDPRIGFENMRTLTRVADPERREEAQAALLAGKSPDTIKQGIREPGGKEEPAARLRKERDRLERQIRGLQRRIAKIDEKLGALETQA